MDTKWDIRFLRMSKEKSTWSKDNDSTEESFLKVSAIVVGAHLPVMIIEGIVTALCVAFLKKVQPEMLPRGGS